MEAVDWADRGGGGDRVHIAAKALLVGGGNLSTPLDRLLGRWRH